MFPSCQWLPASLSPEEHALLRTGTCSLPLILNAQMRQECSENAPSVPCILFYLLTGRAAPHPPPPRSSRHLDSSSFTYPHSSTFTAATFGNGNMVGARVKADGMDVGR